MAIYYIKESGSNGTGLDDANAWSPAYFDSIQASGLSIADTVLFKTGGFYPLWINTQRDSLTYGAYGTGDKPIISGLQALNSWTLHSGSIYWASLDVDYLNLVKLDGIARGMGRYPNTGYLTYTAHTGNTSISGATIGAIPFDPTGAEVVIRKFRWILDRHFITSRSGNTLNYSTVATHGQNNNYNPVDGNGFFIQNTIHALTEEGDWYYDPTANRLYMHFGIGSPSGRIVEASVRDRNIQINTKSGITVNDLVFEGANDYGAHNIGSSSLIYSDCDFKNQGRDAFWSSYINDMQIVGGLYLNCFNNGIYMEQENDNVLIDGVDVQNIQSIAGAGKSGDSSGNGITAIGDGIDILNSFVSDTGFNGIYFAGNNILVQNNDVDTFCTVKDDGGGIYTFSQSTSFINRIVRDNKVRNAIGAYAGAEAYDYEAFGKAAAIYLDGYIDNLSLIKNDLETGEWCGIFLHENVNNITVQQNKVSGFPKQLMIYNYLTNRLRSLNVSQNRFNSVNNELCVYIYTQVDEFPDDWGTWENNIYNNPHTNITMGRLREGLSEVKMTLKTWRDEYGVEVGSLSNPKVYRRSGLAQLRAGKLLVKSE